MVSTKIYGIIYFIVAGIFAIPSVYVLIQDQVDFIENWESYHEKYYDRLILATQGILGLIIIMTIFYLGKNHDYTKDLIKSESELREIVWKFKERFPSRNWEIDEKTFKISDNVEDTYQQIEDIFNVVPKFIVVIFIMQLIIIGLILVIASVNEGEGDQKMFFVSSIFLILATSELFVVWGLYESIITLHKKTLRSVLFGITDLKKHLI